jgi:tRNA dimethylallyltransferase
VVNGDPFQAYRDLPVGTGQPSPAEFAGAPHLRATACCRWTPRLNPAGFGALVRGWLQDRRPVLVTGSGLYLRGIWDQLSDLPEVPEALTARVRRWADRLGAPVLHRFLAAVDPHRAAALHPNDRSRVQRALALHLATGCPPSRLLEGIAHGVPEGWRALLVLPSRERGRARVAVRVRQMLAQGWPEEVARLRGRAWSPSCAACARWATKPCWIRPGVPGPRIIQETQAYAKRQGTFFRNQWPGIPVWDPDQESMAEAFLRLGLEPPRTAPPGNG